jgi:hypothetical protein
MGTWEMRVAWEIVDSEGAWEVDEEDATLYGFPIDDEGSLEVICH